MVEKTKSVELSLKHLTSKNFGKIPENENKDVVSLALPHVEAFNYFLGEGLDSVLAEFDNVEFTLGEDEPVSLSICKYFLPYLRYALGNNLYPRECIERGSSYSAPLMATIMCTYNGNALLPIRLSLGNVPIMVKSKNCHLNGLTPEELVKRGELVNETGGYFIVNGAPKVMRMLIANRSNYPLAMARESWKKRLEGLTEKGVFMRCEAVLISHVVNILHYLNTGDAKLQFILRNQGYFVPLVMVLKALMDFTDHQIFLHLIRGRESDKYFKEKIKNMMLGLQHEGLYNQEMCKKYIGKTFRHRLTYIFPNWFTDEQICEQLFRRCVLIHITTNAQKFDTLCMMARKLYAFVADEAKVENADKLSMQQVTIGGYTLLQFTKELLTDYLVNVKFRMIKMRKKNGDTWKLSDKDFRDMVIKEKKVGPALQYLLATGNLRSKSGCGLMQTTGLAVFMEHLNRMRDLSHLRSVHRGTYFSEMKTLEPRRLTGEAWGFICPVHTPDGAPCGLLNHLSQDCLIVNEVHKDKKKLLLVLITLGMIGVNGHPHVPHEQCLEVVLDGVFVGYIPYEDAESFAQNIRLMKISGEIFKYTEVVLLKRRKYGGQYPALFLATSLGRMMRPVINLSTRTVEYIGTFEQLYMDIAVSPEDYEEGVHTHMEISKTTILSNIAKLVPFSDCNPIPRNMYQCQMGKQTMGTPFHNWRKQTTSKCYRLQYPQVPLVRNSHYDNINMEEFCMGFNAIVAICSYTGYDMEDAMVINKCSMERGLGHGQIYKSEFIDLTQSTTVSSNTPFIYFRRNPETPDLDKILDQYGLPYPGTKLTEGDPYYCTYNVQTRIYRLTKYKGEDCIVDKYSIMGASTTKYDFQRVNITLRVPRPPIIGDKFASRAGQKGILSRLYPTEDLPFSERGIIPDLMFNPHGMPSRMTAGVLLELLGGKAAAEFGKSFDSSPFEFSDEDCAVDYFGKILEKGGFSYYGEDTLYSGTDGRMMEAQIYMGVIYYQRLRHMTADKWQVRQTGPIDILTRQPIKGRKKGGAIRFGEMERDCLISHGASYMLQDRLLGCSDAHEEWICEQCQESMSPIVKLEETTYHIRSRLPVCALCGPSATLHKVTMPYAFKYMIAELACIGISVKFGIKKPEKNNSKHPQVLVNGDMNDTCVENGIDE
ncbi:LOW QUALITY PROTEIN: DNA-directed RNA polymerase I subunit RPA2-like [Macrobrachium nipponense]|uniref:LOW QUALITY PROTEIN: DNA-directed RNA polymerase I subunit RPA2-like n=1 Tax=Macrobrachium nipponense TaxID=159736 RepID=UPI0030C88A99